MQALIYNSQTKTSAYIQELLHQHNIQTWLLESSKISELLKIQTKLEEKFFLLDATNFFDFDPQIMLDFIQDRPALLALYFKQEQGIYANLNSDFLLLPKPNLNNIDGYTSANIYLLKKSLLQDLQAETTIEDFFYELYTKSKLYALPLGGFFITKPTQTDFSLIQQRLQTKIKPALFLDRDNLLIEDSGYTVGTNIKCLTLADEYIAKFNIEQNPVIVVSNQSGIARGYFGLSELEQTNQAVAEAYKAKGLIINDFFYCPYHTVGTVPKYIHSSKLRKPEAGMIFQAAQKYRIDLKNSLMFGDNPQTDLLNLPYLKSQILN